MRSQPPPTSCSTCGRPTGSRSIFPSELRPASFDDAYAIQRRVVAGLLPAGGRRIGYKAACTSPIAQAALEVDGPLFGQLLSHSSRPSGSTLAASDFVHRVIEAEFAFRLGADVTPVAGGHTIESIAACIDAVIPAIEVVDYHYVAWTIGALQVAADNAIHGAWVYGAPRHGLGGRSTSPRPASRCGSTARW